MTQEDTGIDDKMLSKQQQHWENVFSNDSSKFGEKPSESAMMAAEIFRKEEKTKILELGAGQGRDAIFFASKGFDVFALDYSSEGIECINQKAQEMELSGSITALQHDAR